MRFTKPLLFLVYDDGKAREWIECGSVGKVAESTFCKGFVDHATGRLRGTSRLIFFIWPTWPCSAFLIADLEN